MVKVVLHVLNSLLSTLVDFAHTAKTVGQHSFILKAVPDGLSKVRG